MATEEELTRARLAHAEQLGKANTLAFPSVHWPDRQERYASCQKAAQLVSNAEKRQALPHEADIATDAPHYVVYGRVMAKRGPFLVIRTPFGDVQTLVRADTLSETEAAQYKQVDLADHILVQGPLMQTRTGDAAIRARQYQHLGKALLPPPEKWHGLTDTEKRYRERYVDLFANPEVATIFRLRGRVIHALRRFLDGQGFLEVETPLLHPLRGGATARPFVTHHNTYDLQLYMRIAPELYLKRLLVGGLDRVYEIGRCFRNEGVSTRHNPEFTILEFYMAYANFFDLLELCESMLRSIDQTIRQEFPSLSENRTCDLQAPWAKVTIRESLKIAAKAAHTAEGSSNKALLAFAEHLANASELSPAVITATCEAVTTRLPALEAAKFKKASTHGERIFSLFEQFVEPELTSLFRSADGAHSIPVFITEYPREVSPLARRNDQDPGWVDRFELYVDGRELANAFSELNDPDDQAQRFMEQSSKRQDGDEEAMDYDADYIRALRHGMPPAAGFGLGVDRLIMFLANQTSIRDVLLFPLLRPET